MTADGFAVGSVISSPFKRSESDTIMKKALPQWLMALYRRFATSGPIVTHGPAKDALLSSRCSLSSCASNKRAGIALRLLSCYCMVVQSTETCTSCKPWRVYWMP